MHKKFNPESSSRQNLRFKIQIYFLLFTVCCLLSACASTENLDLLRQDVIRLQSEHVTIKNEINTLKEKTSKVVSEESFNVVRQSQAEVQSLLSNVSRDLQVLSGRFDENKYFMEKTLKDSAAETNLIKAQITGIEKQIKDLQENLNTLEGQIREQKEPPKDQSKENEKKAEEPQKEQPREEQPPKSVAPSDKESKYKAAYSAFQNKRYKEAREKFEAFMKEFPKDELSDNAQFWIAETYYAERDFEGAILAYETLLKKYPKSQKAPAGLLKQGFSFIEIGDKKTGKIILEQLRERYPDSKEAELAKKKIEEIDKKTGKRKK